MRKNETGLGLGAFVCVNDEQQGTVGHVQHALNLAAEVGVAGVSMTLIFTPL